MTMKSTRNEMLIVEGQGLGAAEIEGTRAPPPATAASRRELMPKARSFVRQRAHADDLGGRCPGPRIANPTSGPTRPPHQVLGDTTAKHGPPAPSAREIPPPAAVEFGPVDEGRRKSIRSGGRDGWPEGGIVGEPREPC